MSQEDLEPPCYMISKIINGFCCIPYIFLFVIYGIKIKQCNYSKVTNIGLCLICIIMNITYFFYDGENNINVSNDNNDPAPIMCTIQGALYVGCLIGVAFFCFFISILFFMITVFPQTLEQHTKCFFLSFLIISFSFWIFSSGFLATNATFAINKSIGFCRLDQKNSAAIYYAFMSILIALTSTSIILAGIVIICGKKIAKTEEDYLKFKKKLRITGIVQTICLCFLLLNRFAADSVDNMISWALDIVLCFSWVLLVSIHGFNEQTRKDIKKLLGISNQEKEEPPIGEDMCDILRNSLDANETL